jgi:CRISPR-associated endonuclease/helicase Cas3
MQTNTQPFRLLALARPGQPLLAHLMAVGEQSSRLCPAIASWAKLVGLLHDYGKYRPEWVWGMNEIAQGRNPGKLPYHAMEGALYLQRLLPAAQFKAIALPLIIAAHHGGLPDMKEGVDRLKGQDPMRSLPVMDDDQWAIDEEYKAALTQAIEAADYDALDSWMPLGDYRTAQRLRFLFGALVAADRQDAAGSDGWVPKKAATMAALGERLATWYGATFGEPQGELNQLRSDFYRECRRAALHPPGWLSVRGPCGISKTWSVMQMALDHGARWDKRKVIYCVPWTAILEQSHSQYQEILGEENVLGHWSTLIDPDTTSPKQLRNSRQWWDAPVIATTMVQLFDVLLGSKARTTQRMPSLQDAVIVLDEVQGLPIELLTTCIAVLDQLVQDHGATIILSTATMPDYSILGINPVEVLPEIKVNAYFSGTKRVEYDWREQPLSWQDIADEVVEVPLPSTLIVANTVAGCDDAFQMMKTLDAYIVYKYTASMTPAHRSVVLAEIKATVKATKMGGLPVIICATSAIETGVDLDCSRGYRELSGLESIVQFAGRINRNKGEESSPVIIFKPTDKYREHPRMDAEYKYSDKYSRRKVEER